MVAWVELQKKGEELSLLKTSSSKHTQRHHNICRNFSQNSIHSHRKHMTVLHNAEDQTHKPLA
uniref:Inositol hexakisphosphate and diphosphoinositol-pentakisphosphate kinase 1-like isoform X4 n=1 Tax=Rhizophora mucronata TaxID=61149 RepID=A0A2P2LZS3_RHIMU